MCDNKKCPNCIGTWHRDADAPPPAKGVISICNELLNKLMGGTSGGHVVYPEVVLAVDGIMRGVSVDIGVGSFRASGTLTGKLKRKPDNKEHKRIEMVMTFRSKMMYKVQVSNVTTLSKVDTGTLLTEPKIGGCNLQVPTPQKRVDR